MSNRTNVIDVSNLYKAYGAIRAVDGISFDVKQGEVFGMLGPNGAGKTTTVEIIEGLRTPDSGSVTVLGIDALKDVREVKERIGVQLQTPAFFPKLNVRELVDYYGSLYKKSVPSSEIIDLVALDESRKVLFQNLSGGQQQRLSVALAFVNDPDIIFLDEPTTGLDPQARRTLWEVIEGFRKAGKTILLTTHYMEEAERLCDRIAIMDHGHIIAMGSPRGLIKEHFAESAIQFKMTGYPGREALVALKGVTDVIEEGDEIILYTGSIPVTISALLELASSRSAELSDLSIRHADLEDVFIKLTGKRIRD
ncbi:MAG TPA: ABC transporter ATP-binding protein [Dehalococcoidia bacterium]|nr:ABC transporter ATP-binding protein [Dehalococcoidia bacterium]